MFYRPFGFLLVVAAIAISASACGPKKAPAAKPTAPPATQAAPAPKPAPAPAPAPVPTPAEPTVTGKPADVVAPGQPRPPVPARPPGPPPLLGHVTRAQLNDYESWKALMAATYSPDAAAVATIKEKSSGVAVLLIMGTWCGDSKREVPRFFAIMDAAGIPDSALTMVGVDRTKKDTEGLTDKWTITRVPTFVFLRDGKEVGRFVEKTPAGSTTEAEVAKAIATGK